MAGQPVSLAVDGNAVQDGTPTPDNPIDVQLCGDRILPLGYTAVEYIEGTGTQWIDTDIGSDENTGMYLEAALTEVLQNPPDNGGKNFLGVVGNNFLIGYGNNNDLQGFRFSRKKGVGVTLDYNFATPLDTNKHTFQNNYLNNHKFVLDEESVDAPDAEFKNTQGMAIFRTIHGTIGYYNAPIKAKIYRLKISQDTDIIVDIYPAKRDSDGVVGMYDIIQDKFYTNSGTGKFIAGNGICASYKVSGHVEGLNLFNEKDFGAQTGVITNDDGSFTLPNKDTFTYDIRVESNSTYTLKTISNHQELVGNMLLRFLNEDKQEVNQKYLSSNNSPYVLRTGNINYIRISGTWSTRYTITFKNFQIVQGSYTAETIPPYEPYQPPQDFAVYLPEQIAKVGDVADEVVVDMENRTAELKKNVGSMTMSDSYSGGTSTTDELVRFWHSTTPGRRISPSANIIDVMSDIYEADTWNNIGAGSTDKQFVIAGNPNTQVVNVRVPKSVIGGETKELMNAWAANNPATVYYVLAEPVTTDITSLQQWDAMPSLWSGTAVITADTVIAPSAITAKYYASKPEEVN